MHQRNFATRVAFGWIRTLLLWAAVGQFAIACTSQTREIEALDQDIAHRLDGAAATDPDDGRVGDTVGSESVDTSKTPCANSGDCDDSMTCLDGSCLSAPPPCGSPPNLSCTSWLDETTCGVEGGSYDCKPDFFGQIQCTCLCHTGDAGCPCWAASHCQGFCLADSNPSSKQTCRSSERGACSAERIPFPLGCNCLTFRDAPFDIVCAD